MGKDEMKIPPDRKGKKSGWKGAKVQGKTLKTEEGSKKRRRRRRNIAR